ncbi:hypothetical protein CTAM01_07189 [Colletotrichum tamarilloi]|uniref:Uncharacterized protein n=1 Tax=Colletotrichum tamarilloi TaxID=1209934 RepID=A0ABQ9RA86_9PEZI|nr:uncharacterized protein CTAM01_07189 [Colletotrichum tamarilloi]KAK1499268.1 hypothetical protein CTAM01_07189 [Colletotrichum tamarilloi]
MLLPGFLVFATILSTIVGPASAVLLLPSLGWYEFDTSSAFSKIEPPLLYWWNRRAIWFRDPFSEYTECQGPAGVYRDYCPAGGFPVISSWVRDYAATDLTNNLTFYSTSSDIRRHLVFTQADDKPNTSSTTLTTTPSHFLMTSIGLFQQFIHSSDVGALSREPRYRITAKGGANVKSPTGEGSGNDKSMRDMYYGKSQEDIRVIRFRSNWFKFLNPHWNISNTTTASGVSQIILNFSSKLKVNGKTVNVLAPVDGANNTASEIFLAKVFGVYLAEGLARNSQEQRTRIKLNSTDTELTYLDLNEQHGYLGGVHKITPFNNTHHQDEWRDSTTQRNTTFAAFTEVLNTALPINFTAQRYGYGSGQGRKTLEFAQVMMLIYLGIIAVYAATVGTGYVLELLKVKSGGERIRVLSVIPWSDLQDLIVLALKTPPPSDEDLADAGAGVTSDKVWEKVVRAESDDKRNIQLAFQETTHTRKLDVSRKERYY